VEVARVEKGMVAGPIRAIDSVPVKAIASYSNYSDNPGEKEGVKTAITALQDNSRAWQNKTTTEKTVIGPV
jgi:hypothetical protein